jgi:hypothetical protein
VGDEKPEHDRKRGDHEQAAEHRQEEGDDRMAADEPTDALGKPAVPRPENARRLLLVFAARPKDRRMCFDRGDDGDVARLETF